jgi:hypothetical protein
MQGGWQGRKDSNPQHADLESAALPIGATALTEFRTGMVPRGGVEPPRP